MDIAILPRFRERGIGTALIKEIIDEAAQSAKTVQIYVENFNPSLRLFQGLGFSIIEQDGINLLLECRPPA